MRGLLVVVAGAASLQVACTGQGDCTVAGVGCRSNQPPVVTVMPQRLSLAVGDTASVAVTARLYGRSVVPDARWRWSPGQPAVAVLDSGTVGQPRVRLRATAAGAAELRLAAVVEGITFTTPVSITVR